MASSSPHDETNSPPSSPPLMGGKGGDRNSYDVEGIPPSAIWNGDDGNNRLGGVEEDDRVALLRMPPPSSKDDGAGDGGGDWGGDGGGDGSGDGRRANDDGRPRLGPAPPATPLRLLMKKLGRVLCVSSTAILLLVVFPLLCRSAVHDARRGRTDFAAFYSAAAFVVITLVLSVREILSHMYNWYAPQVQKFVVRILFMVPLYAVQSWLSLRFHGPARVYIDTLRDLYEAYVIQSFVYYLIELLGGEDKMADLLSRKDPSLGGHGPFMSKVLPRWQMGADFLLRIKRGSLQYVVVRTATTLLTTFVLLPSGTYHEGSFSPKHAYVYMTIVLNISVVYALYCLVKLYHAIESDLRAPINRHPVGKFLCVKGVVFFTWWQGVGIYFLRSHGFIGDVGSWSGDDVAGGIIDYLVCIEMVAFSVAHMFTFTYKEYLPEGMEERTRSVASGAVGWLFEGIDKRRRGGRGNPRDPASDGRGGADGDRGRPPSLQSALLEGEEEVSPFVDEDGDVVGQSYRAPASRDPPGFDRLEDPLSLTEAFWSSTVPRETLDDIRRLGVAPGRGGGPPGPRGWGGAGGAHGAIGLTSMSVAESI